MARGRARTVTLRPSVAPDPLLLLRLLEGAGEVIASPSVVYDKSVQTSINCPSPSSGWMRLPSASKA